MLTPNAIAGSLGKRPCNEQKRLRYDVQSYRRSLILACMDLVPCRRSLEKPVCFKIEPMTQQSSCANKIIDATPARRLLSRYDWRVARRVASRIKMTWLHARSSGTISSSRCQITRTSKQPIGLFGMCEFIFCGRAYFKRFSMIANLAFQPNCMKHSRVVEPDGIEPTTSCLQSRRSPN
jgi:hypothetical protein